MDSGARTSASIAQAYLARIDAVDRHGPAINAMIELNPDALAIAEALDRERREKGARGPLHGIPVVLKDNIDTADRMRTSAGSLALGRRDRAARRVRRRAAARRRLRDPRQDQPVGVGELPRRALDVGLERARRADAQPVRARPQHQRVELGLRRPRWPPSLRRDRRRHRDRRLDRQPVVDLRPRRHQADGRPREPRGHHSDRAQPGHGRADGAHRRRRRGAAGRDDRRRSARRRDGRQPRQGARRLHEVPRSGGIEGRAHRRRARVLRRQRPRRPRDRGGARRDEGRGRGARRSRADPAPGRSSTSRNSKSCTTSSRPISTRTCARPGPARACARSRTSSRSTSATPRARCRTSGRSTSSSRRRRGR